MIGSVRPALLRSLAIVGGILVGLVMVEAATRVVGLAPPLRSTYGDFASDPYLPFKPRPLSRAVGRTPEFGYDYQHNALGLRDVEHAVAKPPGTFRIVALGDSFTYGVGVALEETYLSRVEAMLNGRAGAHPRVEIVKAGVPRYFPEAERIMLERYGAEFRPDLVLVAFLPNDVIDTFFGMDAVRVSPSGYLMTREANALGPIGMAIYRRSHLGRLVLKRYVDWRIARTHAPKPAEAFQSDGFHEKDWRQIEREYETMRAITASIGARLMLIHIPQQGPWGETSRYPGSRFTAWASHHGVDFLDLLPAIEQHASRQRFYYEQDGHCTAAGHAVIAQALYAYLTGHQLVP